MRASWDSICWSMRPSNVSTTQPPPETFASAMMCVGASRPSDSASAGRGAEQFVVGRIQPERYVDGTRGEPQRFADQLERNLGLLADFAADDPLGDGRGDRDGRLLPAPQPICLGVVGLSDELVERGNERGDASGELLVQRALGGLLRGDVARRFRLPAELLGLLVRLLHDFGGLAANRL